MDIYIPGKPLNYSTFKEVIIEDSILKLAFSVFIALSLYPIYHGNRLYIDLNDFPEIKDSLIPVCEIGKLGHFSQGGNSYTNAFRVYLFYPFTQLLDRIYTKAILSKDPVTISCIDMILKRINSVLETRIALKIN